MLLSTSNFFLTTFQLLPNFAHTMSFLKSSSTTVTITLVALTSTTQRCSGHPLSLIYALASNLMPPCSQRVRMLWNMRWLQQRCKQGGKWRGGFNEGSGCWPHRWHLWMIKRNGWEWEEKEIMECSGTYIHMLVAHCLLRRIVSR